MGLANPFLSFRFRQGRDIGNAAVVGDKGDMLRFQRRQTEEAQQDHHNEVIRRHVVIVDEDFCPRLESLI